MICAQVIHKEGMGQWAISHFLGNLKLVKNFKNRQRQEFINERARKSFHGPVSLWQRSRRLMVAPQRVAQHEQSPSGVRMREFKSLLLVYKRDERERSTFSLMVYIIYGVRKLLLPLIQQEVTEREWMESVRSQREQKARDAMKSPPPFPQGPTPALQNFIKLALALLLSGAQNLLLCRRAALYEISSPGPHANIVGIHAERESERRDAVYIYAYLRANGAGRQQQRKSDFAEDIEMPFRGRALAQF